MIEYEILNKSLFRQSLQWSPDHNFEAMQRAELESFVRLGLRQYHVLRALDEAWSEDVQSGQIFYDEAVASYIHERYEWWMKPCEKIVERLNRFSISDINDLEIRFAVAVAEVKKLLLTPVINNAKINTP